MLNKGAHFAHLLPESGQNERIGSPTTVERATLYVTLQCIYLHMFRKIPLGPIEHITCSGVSWYLKSRGAKFNDFLTKFEAFVFTNSKSPNIFQRSIKISENLTIAEKLGAMVPSATQPQCPCNCSKGY